MTVEELAAIQNAPAIRPEVAAFALLMEAKLRENDGQKSDWRETELTDLQDGLLDEYGELEEAVATLCAGDGVEDVYREAADVANYAMMIADVVKRLRLPGGVTCLRIGEVRRE
ncbi:MAG TPA: hypothetical protein GXX28_02150 [Firmicutes bacterium]|nr:hypothetical protein [Bacillota bacterium]